MTATLVLAVAIAALSHGSCFLAVQSFSSPFSTSLTRTRMKQRILLCWPSSCSPPRRPDRRRREQPALQRHLDIGTKHELRIFCSKSDGNHDEGIRSTESTSEGLQQLVVTSNLVAAASPPSDGVESSREIHSAQSHTCSNCSKSFPTRNALFRHLRGLEGGDPDDRGLYEASTRRQGCGHASSNSATSEMTIARVPFRVAVQFGYLSQGPLSSTNISAAEMAAFTIRQWLLTPSDGDDYSQSMSTAADEGTGISRSRDSRPMRIVNVTLVSATQASDAKLRAACLRQETDCSAASDVLVLSGEVALALEPNGEPSSSGPHNTQTKLQSVVERYLADRLLRGQSQPNLRIDVIKFVDKPLHAERSCTQYVYHYLMPSRWLVDPENEMAGWMEREGVLVSSSRTNGFDYAHAAEANVSARKQRRPPALVRLKQALRRMESPRLDASFVSLKEEGASPCPDRRTRRRQRVAVGRFGGLAFKTRQAFHNYGDQQLMGAISPNHDVVWRCVDRARIVDFVAGNDDENISVVLEFRGDAFLKHQIRTMAGTALSLANGWLPVDTTVPISTSNDHIVAPLPCAPAGRLYLAATRFHFEELCNSGKPLFDPGADSRVLLASQYRHTRNKNVTNIQWIQHELLNRKELFEEQRVEAEWLHTTETTVCPATQTALSASVDDSGLAGLTNHDARSHAPEAFSNVLTHLRGIVAAESWPETTAARSSVIRGEAGEERKEVCMGSFTVVNPALVNQGSHHSGNKMFPELVKDVFALEQILAAQERDTVMTSTETSTVHPTKFFTSSHRLSSTHCAINCNAQFTPHVDSGRGLGQTMSMIVGLGDYSGGELIVEGSVHDIRYRAVEFDGWKLRHWTRPFHGERFSLVWFTPATGSTKDVANVSESTIESECP